MEMAGSLIAFACGSRCPAMDGQQRNGLFTKHLLQHIKTPNEDIQLLLRAVRKGVVEESKSRQTPFVLHENKDKDKRTLEWSERWSIALQAAIGVNYLHQLSPAILHGDLKSANFLLERNYEGYSVKLCDFGVAQIRNATTRLTTANNQRSITLSWTAPEILNLEDYTEKSDIYSLGIVYWELATCKIPYERFRDDVIRQYVLGGQRLKNLENTPPTFRTIIEKCWAHNPNNRPKSDKLIQMIKQCISVEGNSLLVFFCV
ncbi:unnamed protein product [Adineta steineri]|uniref:Protein kinase domain-containing protein n=1 Tax=Adineta steineri TaxID=433720 RepID=A0A819DMD5_9BILA|nr:unnamed protein product [Adineta steineri]CAF3838276.1 unnamed protein product [Adineta steineri]